MKDKIFIKGAREHNLKNIDVVVPKGKLVVITGLSGSGKSSLAFDTIYAEGQRRYVESLSAYARQFLGIMEKPDVDYIEGLSPAISIDQRTTSRNPRSTVGTVTEIYDYLRLMFARVGVPHCPQCMKPITMQTVDQMVDAIMVLEEGTKLQLLAPVVRGRKGEHTKLIQNAKKNGYIRIRIDGVLMDISDDIKLEKQLKHTIEIVVDRLVMRPGLNKRLTDSVEMCLSLSGGILVVDVIGKEQMLFSQNYACSDCGLSIEELTPRMFSFNNPYGACPNCSGLGSSLKINPDLVIQDKTKALTEEALIKAGWDFSKEDSYSRLLLNSLAIKYNFDVNTPVEKLPKQIMDIVLYGTGKEKIKIEYGKDSDKRDFYTSFEGIINSMERRYAETLSQGQKEYYESFMSKITCRECGGKRLKKESLAVTIADKNIDDIVSMTILQGAQFFRQLELSTRDTLVAEQILKEINARLSFLSDVGLDYLTLDRASGTLSGGEAQRIRLATQIGSGLTGVLYVLDEPSIGLHQRDNNRLLDALKHLRDLGNSLIVVEHDEETMNAADYIIDMGPGAGEHGGLIMAQGDIEKIKANPKSMTGQYLSGVKRIEVPVKRRKSEGKILRVLGAKANNLKDIEVDIPLGVFTCVTGVSGSGKSSLVNEIIYNKLASKLNRAKTRAGAHRDILGLEHLDKVVNIDQSPIGRMPSSNCATYTGLFTHIRDLFSSTSDAKMRGYKPGRFSFNVQGGRCEACKGDGIIKIEMHFLSDIYVPCEVCHSSRYNKETLEVKYKGKSIADVLAMTVSEALEYFKNISKIKRKIQTLCDVGLGYITLGQSATTLSGGEAQRVKLATELSKRATGKTMYILDEPTTGLHIADVHKLIDVLHKLVDTGNSVVVIEHNLDVIKTADYIIDLGPEGGDGGGEVVAKGTPEEVARCKKSFTGSFLKKMLD